MELDGYSEFSLIGSGGNAHVYRAWSDALDQQVAVKILRGAGDDAVNRRFERERKLMAELEDIDGVVPILDSGVTPGGDPYLAMPVYEGGSLQTRLSEDPLEWELAVDLVRTVAHALASAHSKRILHLDVKPANVLLDDQGSPWLGDFGIAEMMGSTASMSAAMMTPAYTPPERLRDAKPSEQTDIYGMGATLFALLSGTAPFGSEDNTNPASVMMSVLNDPVPVDRLPHRTPEALTNLVLRCMSKNASERPSSAEEMIAFLDVVTEGGEVLAPPSIAEHDDHLTVAVGMDTDDLTVARNTAGFSYQQSDVTTQAADLGQRLQVEEDEGRKKGVWVLAAAALVAVIGLGAGSVLAFGGGDDPVLSTASTDGAAQSSTDTDPETESEESILPEVAGVVVDDQVVESEDEEPADDEDASFGSAGEASTASTAATTRGTVAPATTSAPRTTAAPGTTATTAAPGTTASSATTASTGTTAKPSTPPNANFDASTLSVQAGGTATFTDRSTGEVSSISWAFSDGGSSTGSSATHRFSSAGTVTVTMTAKGPGGSDTATKSVTVTAVPVDPPPRPDNEGCQYLGNDVDVQWAFSPLPALVDTYVIEYSNGSRQDIGDQPGPFTTTDNALRKIIAVRDGVENALTVGSCEQHGGTKPVVGAPGLAQSVRCRFHDFFFNDAGVYTWSETWNWVAGADTTSFTMVINQDGSILNVNNGANTSHTTVGVNGQPNSGRSVKGIISNGPGGSTTLTIANCGAMNGTGWQAPNQ